MVVALDACVLTKLFVREPLSDAARALVDCHALFRAPGLVRVEVSAAITRKYRSGELTAGQAEAALGLWDEFRGLGHLRIDEDEGLLPAAAGLSLSLRHPLADCLYLAVADRHGVSLVTADRPFVDALGGPTDRVRHLADLGP